MVGVLTAPSFDYRNTASYLAIPQWCGENTDHRLKIK